MKSVMQDTASLVPQVRLSRSKFSRTSGHKFSMDAGYLYPFFVDEVIPGDTHICQNSFMVRLASPLKSPIMDNLFFETFFFFVPSRLVWDNFQRFMGESQPGHEGESYVVPVIDINPLAPAWTAFFPLADCLGIPVNRISSAGVHCSVNALPFRAINLIYNEWFRDENLTPSVTVRLGDTGDAMADYQLRRRVKRRDYFTSCLPWPQAGDDVILPIGSTAPVVNDGSSPSMRLDGGSTYTIVSDTLDPGAHPLGLPGSPTGGAGAVVWANSGLRADLSSATAATINDIREAFQIQRLLERDARGGRRYIEILLSHFGVRSPDARLQRPEYLGGGSSRIMVRELPQLSSSVAGSPQGTLAATGSSHIPTGHSFSKSFVEHGYIIGFCNVRADLTYQQGLDRIWTRSTRFDFYWPVLAGLGEQAVLNREIFFQGTSEDLEVFGYLPRYEEYRGKRSVISGIFNSEAAAPLDSWHLSQDFGSLPTLNTSFIEDDPPIDRVVAVTNQPQFLVDSLSYLTSIRPMPTFGVPGMVDHF